MDAGIVKFLEEDEDEHMHSGEAVEAFSAALNRDIGGISTVSSVSASAPLSESHGNNGELSQGALSGSNLSGARWQPFTSQQHDENQRQQQKHEQQDGEHLQQASSKNNSCMNSNRDARLGIIQISMNNLNRVSCNNRSRVGISRWRILKCSKNNISNSNS